MASRQAQYLTPTERMARYDWTNLRCQVCGQSFVGPLQKRMMTEFMAFSALGVPIRVYIHHGCAEALVHRIVAATNESNERALADLQRARRQAENIGLADAMASAVEGR